MGGGGCATCGGVSSCYKEMAIYICVYISARQEIFTHLTFDGCERFDAIYFDWISLPRQVAALSVCPSVCLSPSPLCMSVCLLSVYLSVLATWFGFGRLIMRFVFHMFDLSDLRPSRLQRVAFSAVSDKSPSGFSLSLQFHSKR